MTSSTSRTVILAAFGAAAFALAPQAHAAHAGAPYTNVDHSNDAGNNTGDSEVEKLNEAQLDKNYHPPAQPQPGSASGGAAPTTAPHQ